MDTPKDEAHGPFATPVRAAEIALMAEFRLPEFIELTGVGVSSYGIYRVTASGVSIEPENRLGDFSAAEQLQMQRTAERFRLEFPCTPAEFLTWYKSTCGELHKGVRQSDFPLAEGFIDALENAGGSTADVRRDSVISPEIVAAFRVKPDEAENKQWWDDRMRHAIRYKLKSARVNVGRAERPASWDPLQIAIWLIDKGHLSPEKVRRAVEAHFPKVDSNLL